MADPNPSAVPRPIDDKARGIDDRGVSDQGLVPPTKTSMATDPPPLERRPQEPPRFPLIIKTIDVFQLAGSHFKPEAEVASASRIWSQCGIEFRIVSRDNQGVHHYDEARTRELLATSPGDQQKPLNELTVVVNPDGASPSQKNLREEWLKNKSGNYAVFFAPNVYLTTSSGASSAADPDFDLVYIGKREHWPGYVVAHELGHRLIDPHGTHASLTSPLMHTKQDSDEIVELECRAARGDAKALYEIYRRDR